MDFSILFSGFAALTALALAKPPHARAVFGRDVPPVRRQSFRAAGWVVIAGLFVVAIWRHGWTVGTTCGIAVLAVTGFSVTLTLTYCPRVLPVLAGMALVVAGGFVAFAR